MILVLTATAAEQGNQKVTTAEVVQSLAASVIKETASDPRAPGSKYNEWIYGNTLITFAMNGLAKEFSNADYQRHGARIVRFIYDNESSFANPRR